MHGKVAVYRSICIGLLDSPQYRKLSAEARSVYLHSRINIGQWGIVVWYGDEATARIANTSGYSAATVKAAFRELAKTGWVQRCDNVLWIKEHLSEDPHLSPLNPKHRLALLRHLVGLPRLPIVKDFAYHYELWVPIEEAMPMGMSWLFDGNDNSMPFQDSDSEKDSDTEEDSKSTNYPLRGRDEKPSRGKLRGIRLPDPEHSLPGYTSSNGEGRSLTEEYDDLDDPGHNLGPPLHTR